MKFKSLKSSEFEQLDHKLEYNVNPDLPCSVQSTPKLEPEIKKEKLKTFDGVYIPVVSSIWGIIFFLRLPYIISQCGLLLTMSIFIASYAITTLTTLSISAISTNGKVKGGGAYYMISRSLGPEFGGSIGLVNYFGAILNACLNALAFVEALLNGYGAEKGSILNVIPEGYYIEIFYSSIIVILCIFVSLFGSKVI